ncbi:hypothetical protein L596_007582 [Steinernema carpocapsae]|uniref:Uncharacterized protein n=1 Tax=Steinernema carpocapsae TaxID=34508 RepID=A0A4U5PA51_STECR|nr:hypothetical protein L596_007582 [Steinernema carpocapsae]
MASNRVSANGDAPDEGSEHFSFYDEMLARLTDTRLTTAERRKLETELMRMVVEACKEDPLPEFAKKKESASKQSDGL